MKEQQLRVPRPHSPRIIEFLSLGGRDIAPEHYADAWARCTHTCLFTQREAALEELDSAVELGYVRASFRDAVRRRYVPLYHYKEETCDGGDPQNRHIPWQDRHIPGKSFPGGFAGTVIKMGFALCGEENHTSGGLEFFYQRKIAGDWGEGMFDYSGDLRVRSSEWGVKGESVTYWHPESLFRWFAPCSVNGEESGRCAGRELAATHRRDLRCCTSFSLSSFSTLPPSQNHQHVQYESRSI
jgi:hypothetical protein